MTAKKHNRTHPYAAIEHRVMDCPNFTKLTPSAVILLLIFARQLNGKNNGKLIATFDFVKKYGIASQHTVSRCIKELLHYGFIFQTKIGGYNRGAGLFAVTWISIEDKTDIYPANFEMHAWRHEKTIQDAKNALRQDAKSALIDFTLRKFTYVKSALIQVQKRNPTPIQDAKNALDTYVKSAHSVSVTNTRGEHRVNGRRYLTPTAPQQDDDEYLSF